MTVPRRPVQRPRIEERIALWLTAYRAVLDEISTEGGIDRVLTRITAAEVAAELVKGVESGDNAGTR